MPKKTGAKGKDAKGKDAKGKKGDSKKGSIPGAKKGKAKKKKWSKTKVKEKLQNAVFYDKPLYDKLLSEIPRQKLITTATVSDKLKVNGSLARLGIRELLRLDKIRQVGDYHSGFTIYTRNTKS